MPLSLPFSFGESRARKFMESQARKRLWEPTEIYLAVAWKITATHSRYGFTTGAEGVTAEWPISRYGDGGYRRSSAACYKKRTLVISAPVDYGDMVDHEYISTEDGTTKIAQKWGGGAGGTSVTIVVSWDRYSNQGNYPDGVITSGSGVIPGTSGAPNYSTGGTLISDVQSGATRTQVYDPGYNGGIGFYYDADDDVYLGWVPSDYPHGTTFIRLYCNVTRTYTWSENLTWADYKADTIALFEHARSKAVAAENDYPISPTWGRVAGLLCKYATGGSIVDQYDIGGWMQYTGASVSWMPNYGSTMNAYVCPTYTVAGAGSTSNYGQDMSDGPSDSYFMFQAMRWTFRGNFACYKARTNETLTTRTSIGLEPSGPPTLKPSGAYAAIPSSGEISDAVNNAFLYIWQMALASAYNSVSPAWPQPVWP